MLRSVIADPLRIKGRPIQNHTRFPLFKRRSQKCLTPRESNVCARQPMTLRVSFPAASPSRRGSAESQRLLFVGMTALALLERSDGAVIADRIRDTACTFLAGLYKAEQAIADRLIHIVNGKLPWSWIDEDKAVPWVDSPAVCSCRQPKGGDPPGAEGEGARNYWWPRRRQDDRQFDPSDSRGQRCNTNGRLH